MALSVYLAGKITKSDWRDEIVPGLSELDHGNDRKWPILKGAVAGGHDYVGPYLDDRSGHGQRSTPNGHGQGSGGLFDASSREVSFKCEMALESADLVFAWIDSASCHGTLVEIGWANARNIPVWIAGYPIEDLWFAFSIADQIRLVQGPKSGPLDCWNWLLQHHGRDLQWFVAADKRLADLQAKEIQQSEVRVTMAAAMKPNQIRANVWDKSCGHCWYCGRSLSPFRDFHIDHMTPKCMGGSDDMSNLVPACRDCNLRKGGKSVEQYRTQLGGFPFWFEQQEREVPVIPVATNLRDRVRGLAAIGSGG